MENEGGTKCGFVSGFALGPFVEFQLGPLYFHEQVCCTTRYVDRVSCSKFPMQLAHCVCPREKILKGKMENWINFGIDDLITN